MKENIKPATGRLGVLVVGVGGAVATTMITGTLAARKGLAKAIGSIAQMATMRMQDGKEHLIKDIAVSYTHLRAHETGRNLVCRLLLEKKKKEK